MLYTTRVGIGAPAERVWSVLVDLERWPAWTPTVTALEVLDGAGPHLRVGARVRISQPRVAPTVYTVTQVDAGRRFSWEARRPGLRQAADHEVEVVDRQNSTVALTFTVDGPVGSLVSPLVASTVRRIVETEADALRERVENGVSGQR